MNKLYKFMKMYQHNAGHMTKIAAMPIYGTNTLKILFPGTTGPILIKLCMKYQIPKPFIICANYDPGLTLTYFMARPNLQLRLNMGKCDIDGFFGIYCILSLTWHLLNVVD